MRSKHVPYQDYRSPYYDCESLRPSPSLARFDCIGIRSPRVIFNVRAVDQSRKLIYLAIEIALRTVG